MESNDYIKARFRKRIADLQSSKSVDIVESEEIPIPQAQPISHKVEKPAESEKLIERKKFVQARLTARQQKLEQLAREKRAQERIRIESLKQEAKTIRHNGGRKRRFVKPITIEMFSEKHKVFLRLLAQGYSPSEIARQLNLYPSIVNDMVERIFPLLDPPDKKVTKWVFIALWVVRNGYDK
jgi:hypothetical protein